MVPIAILIFSIGLRGADPFFLYDGRLKIFDLFQVLKPRLYDPVPVRFIDLDDKSLTSLGQWPWPRNLVARLVSRLRQAGATVIAFNIVFAEPDRASPNRVLSAWSDTPEVRAQRDAAGGTLPDYDHVLADTIGRGGVVTGFILTDGDPGRPPASKAGFATAGDNPRRFVATFTGAVTNLAAIEKASAGNGSLNILPERDNVVRSAPLLVAHQGKLYPSLAMEALRVAQGAKAYVVKSSGASRTEAFGTHTGVSRVKVGSFVVPTDAMGRLLLYDTGHVPARTLSAWRVLADDFDPGEIEGIIAIIGTSAAGLKDLRATPLNPAAAGAEVQVQAVEQILLQTFLLRPDWAYGAEIGYLFLLGVFLMILLPRVGAAWCALIGGGSVAAAIALSWYAFANLRLLLDPVYPSLVVLAVYMSSSLIGYLRTEAEKRQVRKAFGLILAPALVDRMVELKEMPTQGGELREITVWLSDLEGYSTISEILPPTDLVDLLNSVYTVMSDTIEEYDGFVAQFVGDAVVAAFGTPLEDPDHARHGIEAAMTCCERVAKLRERLDLPKGLKLRIRIGVSTGKLLVGYIGSQRRLSYSIIGDDINVASRLEGVNKVYGSTILVNEVTKDLCGPKIIFREVDVVRVKGRDTPVRIYEPLGRQGTIEEEQLSRMQAFARALDLFRNKRFEDAAALFDSLSDSDPVSRNFAVRARELVENPPPEDWDGVNTLLTK